MAGITNTTQLSTFTLIKTIILTNSVLASKFNARNIYEIEPKHKSVSFSGFPYLWIKVPSVIPDDDNYLGDRIERAEFEVEIIIRMDYDARTNYTSYASNLVTVLRGARSTFKASNYDLGNVEHTMGPDILESDQKTIVEGTVTLMLHGDVNI